jgi:hypothetical protein
MRAARTFAATPKSTHLISPGSVLFILRFHGIEYLKPLECPSVKLGQSCGFLLCIE